MNNFQPTHLYVKQHSVTGLLYFGKTTKKDPIKYTGSGLHWGRHIKIHGKEHVVTLWHELFDNQEDCTDFALFFSEEMDIVKSDKWANLRDENGIDGWPIGQHQTEESKKQISDKMKIKMTGIVHSDATRVKMSESAKLRISSSETCKKISMSNKNRIFSTEHLSNLKISNQNHSDEKRLKLSISAKRQTICPYCSKIGAISNMTRYHFDKCKLKKD